jgi:hypothetical protein
LMMQKKILKINAEHNFMLAFSLSFHGRFSIVFSIQLAFFRSTFCTPASRHIHRILTSNRDFDCTCRKRSDEHTTPYSRQ